MGKHTVREAILDCLIKIEKSQAYSHIMIDETIEREKLSSKDANLFTEVVYGSLQRQYTLDYYIDEFVKGTKPLADWVRILLRMSVYQMVFLDRIPEYAIINEAVNIAKKRGHRGIASLVNGLLRNIHRQGVKKVEDIEDLSIRTSHPQWMIERWENYYGRSTTEKMCSINLERKPLSVRIQPLKITREEAMKQLALEGVIVQPSSLSKQGLMIEEGNVFGTSLFQEGYLTIQDQTSMLVSEMLKPEPGMTVLDSCSAPGGKTTHIAELMKNEGEIFAYDLHGKKLSLVKRQADLLGLSIIETKRQDARKLKDFHSEKTFDRILIDAPCSGLGVLRGKPDIKYEKTAEDIERLADIQFNILQTVAPLLKEDGLLIYSTCTVERQENEQVVKRFLEESSDFMVDDQFFQDLPKPLQDSPGQSDWGLQIFPQSFNTDGFFLTRLRRKK